MPHKSAELPQAILTSHASGVPTEDGPGKIAAIFDLDNTLVAGSTGTSVVRYLYAHGMITKYVSPMRIARLLLMVASYRFSMINATRLMLETTAVLEGIPVAGMWRFVDEWFEDAVVQTINPGAMERLQWHRDQGHQPVICTASSQYSAFPIARYLGIDRQDVIYTNWLDDGKFMTGALRLPITYGAGKVYWLRQWAAQRGVDLAASYFYTDHESDMPLLNLVAHPVAANPYPRLAQIAAARDWEILHWYEKK